MSVQPPVKKRVWGAGGGGAGSRARRGKGVLLLAAYYVAA